MELQNFTLVNGHELLVDGWRLDLHNDYDLESVAYEKASSSAMLCLKRNEGNWVDSSLPSEVSIEFINVSKFMQIKSEFNSNSNTIAFIGFLFPESEVMDGYLEEFTEPTQDLIICTEANGAIKLHAEKVVVSAHA